MNNIKKVVLSLLGSLLTLGKKAAAWVASFIVNFSFTKKNIIIMSVTAVVIVVITILAFKGVFTGGKNSSNKITIALPKATLTLNKDFSFPLRDADGKTVSSIKYTIESAQLMDEIVVKGQIAKSVKGRTFLVLNIKIVNDYEKEIQIKTSDYVRLSVNGNKVDWLAADAHNDPVAVAPTSTKIVKIGFGINDSDHDLLLRIGEIKGDKTELPINFK